MNYPKLLIVLLSIFACQQHKAQDFISQWDMNLAGPSASYFSFQVETLGVVNYTWTTVPASTSGTGTFTNGTIIISGFPVGSTVRLSIEPTNFKRISRHAFRRTRRILQLCAPILQCDGSGRTPPACGHVTLSSSDVRDQVQAGHRQQV